MKTIGYTLSTACALALVLVIGGGVGAQRGNVDWAAVGLSTHHVAGTVHYLEGRGGNIGLSVGDDGVIMIDDQYAPLTDRIVDTIRRLSTAEITWLINTHVHGDHTGGNENFGKMGVPILAQDVAGMAGANTKIIPGHGVVSTREDVTEFRDMVITVADRVTDLVEQGSSYDQVVAADPTREFNATWGDPGRFLTAVYAELGGEI